MKNNVYCLIDILNNIRINFFRFLKTDMRRHIVKYLYLYVYIITWMR